MSHIRKFEQTEMTKIILMALKSFKNRGRVNNMAFGNLLQTYHQIDIEKCTKLIEQIEKENLDVRLNSRDY